MTTCFRIGDSVQICQTLTARAESGYLQVPLGSTVQVLYVGACDNAEEHGWIFGKHANGDEQGWLPSTSVLPLPVALHAPGDLVQTLQPLHAKACGYLQVPVGSTVEVLYVGKRCNAEENGWLFGRHLNGDEQGWLPSAAVRSYVQPHLDIVSITARWALNGEELGCWSLPCSASSSVLLQAAEVEANGLRVPPPAGLQTMLGLLLLEEHTIRP